ncbi:hypothetical protein [Streptomyces sp. NPDC053427]|uniref:hypothetical protein n=1 Tax=Streptomyces sp. NPDC053427 TaxID=3365701 RepID=UPI0037D60CC9
MIRPHITRRRMRAAVAGAVAAVLLLLLASLTSTYSGANAGATVGRPGCFIGIEWRGAPGVFGSCDGTDPDANTHH